MLLSQSITSALLEGEEGQENWILDRFCSPEETQPFQDKYNFFYLFLYLFFTNNLLWPMATAS